MNSFNLPSSLVSPEWLAQHIDEPNLVVLDASLKKPISGASSDAGSTEHRIPGAQYFNFDNQICDRTSDLPHMMPTAKIFTAEAQKLGITKNSIIVIYDSLGVYSSPRGWWMFRAMGHSQVAVLNGGYPAWKAAGYQSIEVDTNLVQEANFEAILQADLIWDSRRVLASLSEKNISVIDARSEVRFLGIAPEPRRGLRGGHMPGAINLPFDRLTKDGMLLSEGELEKIFRDKKISHDDQLVFSCGSGVTACVLALGAELAGYSRLSVYDGSWSEWGIPSDLPVVS